MALVFALLLVAVPGGGSKGWGGLDGGLGCPEGVPHEFGGASRPQSLERVLCKYPEIPSTSFQNCLEQVRCKYPTTTTTRPDLGGGSDLDLHSPVCAPHIVLVALEAIQASCP